MGTIIEVTQTDANKYCRVLTVLGREEEGDPVAEIETLRKAAERYLWLRHGDNDERCIRLTSDGQPYMLRAALLDRCIDEAIADDADKAAHTVAVPAVR